MQDFRLHAGDNHLRQAEHVSSHLEDANVSSLYTYLHSAGRGYVGRTVVSAVYFRQELKAVEDCGQSYRGQTQVMMEVEVTSRTRSSSVSSSCRTASSSGGIEAESKLPGVEL